MPSGTDTRSRKNTASTRTGSNKAPARRRSKRTRSGTGALLELSLLTFWGRIILLMIAAAVLAAINLLVSSNNFDLFFQMTGVELVLVAVIFWIRFMVKKS